MVDEQQVGAVAAERADPAFANRAFAPWRLHRGLDDRDAVGFEDSIEASRVLGGLRPQRTYMVTSSLLAHETSRPERLDECVRAGRPV